MKLEKREVCDAKYKVSHPCASTLLFQCLAVVADLEFGRLDPDPGGQK
jgi:hypothetical protein